jgi:hypothetical protein
VIQQLYRLVSVMAIAFEFSDVFALPRNVKLTASQTLFGFRYHLL